MEKKQENRFSEFSALTEDEIIEFDDVIPYLGGCGRYQILMCTALWLPVILGACPAFNQVFMIAIPDHWCSVPELQNANLTLEQVKNMSLPWETNNGETRHSRCEMYDVNYTQILYELETTGGEMTGNVTGKWPKTPCLYGWDYDKTWYDRTIVTEWDLVCDRSWMGSFSMSMYSVGGIIGTTIFGWIGDRFGRRPGFFSTWLVQLVFGVTTAFSPDFITFTISRIFVGSTIPAIYMTPFIISLEIVGPDKHSMVSSVIWEFFSIGYMALPLIAWATKDWRMTALYTSAPMGVFLIYYWILPESPRWLLTHGQKPKADKIVRKIANVNGARISDHLISRVKIPEDRAKAHQEGDVTQLWKQPYLFKKFIAVMIVWVCNTIVYIGLSYGAGTFIAENAYLSFFFSGAVEVVAYVVIWPLMEIRGRRWPTFGFMAIASASCLLMLCFPPGHKVSIALAMLAKLSITASFTSIYLHSAEICPTTLRALGMGICAFFANVSNIITPQIVYLSYYSNSIPLVIFGIIAAVGGLLVLYVPETLNENLPETAEEAEEFGKDQKILSCHIKKEPNSQRNREINGNFVKHKDGGSVVMSHV